MATVANIITLSQEDLRETFAASGSTSILIEYTNRIQQTILGKRRWSWMLSVPKRFITERGQTDYWIGATGSESAGQVDTTLNLTDVRWVQTGSVLSRSGFVLLHPETEAPLVTGYQNEDGSYDEGPPQWYRNDRASVNLLQIYPAPDEGSTYELVPGAPHSTTGAGGSLAARTYYIRTTFVDLAGNEGEPSTTARQFVEASKKVTVKAPQPAISVGSAGVSYLRYNVYASTTEGSEKKQNASPTATSANWTEADTGLTTTGAAVPTSFDLEPLRGYVIELRYYKAHTTLTATTDTLLVPDDYRDIVVTGVNWLACDGYLKRFDEAARWRGLFLEGLLRMTKDEYPWPGGRNYMRPDPASQVPSLSGGGINWWSPD